MTGEEYDALARDLKPIVRPELVVIAETAGGAVAGFALAHPDINMALAANRGGGLLRGLWCLLTRRSRIDTCRILVLGVLPEYRRTGAAGVLFHDLASRAHALGYRYGEASWILEDNLMMIRAAETMQGRRTKTYRIYEMGI
jgi:GNAT superfamily N-acetyltransferase